MLEKLQNPKNNLFQSQAWADFQKEVGKEPIFGNDYLGLKTAIFRNRDFLWLQRGPLSVSKFKAPTDLSKNTVFIRLEPLKLSNAEIRKLGLREVKRTSLLGGQKSPKATRLLDLQKSEEELLAQMKSKTRYNVRLGEKKGVRVRFSSDPAETQTLFNLLQKTQSRGKGFHHFEESYYAQMMESLAPKGNLYLALAEYKGQPIAGLLLSIYGEVATYLHGGFNQEKRELMAPFLLQWEAIKFAKSKGCSVYDFWGIAETDSPKDSWAGITKFKEGFGGEKIVFPGAYDLVLNKFWYNVLTFAAKLRKAFRR